MIPVPHDSECVMILLRHGATENNLADPPILQGKEVNKGLSPQGRKQVEASRTALGNLPIKACYASPLVRAQETASIIAVAHGLSVATIEHLEEVDVGDWEGRSWVHIAEEDRDAYRNFMSDPATFGYLNGESLNDVHRRVMPVLVATMQRHLGELILVVAHNVVNRVFLADAMGIAIREAREIPQDNCGINIIKFSAQTTKVKTLNATLHLPD